jgi:signal transduction histidine kinase
MLDRLTIRARLTVVYGGLFLVAGVFLLALTYLLVGQRLPVGVMLAGQPDQFGAGVAGTFTQRVVVGDSTVPVAELPSQLRSAALGSLLKQGGIALGMVSVIAIGVGWLLAGRALDPLHRITATARRIASAPAADRGLHERIALTGPRDEVRELADTFDAMLQRLDQAFDGQRRFVANASHELRTPLTINRSLIEVAMRRRTASEDVRQLGELLLEVNGRHERLIEGLLLLARSGTELTNRSYVDTADVAVHVVALAESEAAAAGVTVFASTGEAPVLGDAVLLVRLVQNLVENGVRHNVAEDGWVRVQTGRVPFGRPGAGSAEVVVRNTGPVVPVYEVPHRFEPFRRHGPDRVVTGHPGIGLGLSIVRSVARAHGGDVSAVAREGGGLAVTVTLPAAVDPPVDRGTAATPAGRAQAARAGSQR